MGLSPRAPLIWAGLAAALGAGLLAACTRGWAVSDERQIRERIGEIRKSLRAGRADGWVQFVTPDWTCRDAEGKERGRTAFLEQTRQVIERVAVESCDTEVQSIEVRGARAAVRLRQTQVRNELGSRGERARWKVVHLETQEWVNTSRGWLVARVQIYPATREALSPT